MTTPHKFMRIFTFFFFCFTQMLYAQHNYKICQELYPANYDYNDVLKHLNIPRESGDLNILNELNNRLFECKEASSKYIHLDFVKCMYYRRTKENELADSIVEHYLYSSNTKYCSHIEFVIGGYIYHLSGENRYAKLIDLIHFLEERRFGLTDEFVYENLASLYFNLKHYEQAAEHFTMLLEIAKKQPKHRSGCYNNLALCYEYLGNVVKAKESYKKALEYWDKGEFKTNFQKAYYKYFKKIIENNIITLDLDSEGEYKDSVMYCIIKEEYQLSFIEDTFQGGVSLLFQLAEYAYKTGDLKNAIEYTNQIIKETKNGKMVSQERLALYHTLLSQKLGIEGKINEMIKHNGLIHISVQNHKNREKQILSETIIAKTKSTDF